MSLSLSRYGNKVTLSINDKKGMLDSNQMGEFEISKNI